MSEMWEDEDFTEEAFGILDAVEAIDYCSVVETINYCKPASTLMSLNVQNLATRVSDIAADPVFKMVDFLALSETWDDVQHPTQVPGFSCVTRAKRDDVSVAGVAIHQHSSASCMVVPHTIRKACTSHDVELGLSDSYGDICAAEITIMNRKSLLICVYISADTTMKQKKFFMTRNFFEYQTETMPIIVTGNFNVDLANPENHEFADFMAKYLKLSLASDPAKPTNLGGSCVDLTFTRNIMLESKSYCSCFFFHRPILSMLK